jgi:hypothetical protein
MVVGLTTLFRFHATNPYATHYSSMSPINGLKFAGVFQAISPSNDWEKHEALEIEDDVEGEQETFMGPDATADEDENVAGPNAAADEGKVAQLKAVLLNASKGVIDHTDEEYRRCTPS